MVEKAGGKWSMTAGQEKDRCGVGMKTNVVNVVGGLGNQLFQYLFGLALEGHSGLPSAYDVSDFDHYRTHGGLTIEAFFDVELPRAQHRPWLARHNLLKRLSGRLCPSLGPLRPFETDATFTFPPAAPLGRGRYFRGYWQAKAYEDETLRRVRDALQFRPTIAAQAEQALARLSPDPRRAASVQIRRGDYMSLPKDSPLYPLPMSYYRRAMDVMAEQAGVDRFYIFSDDIEAVRRELDAPYELVFVDKTMSSSAGVDLAMLTAFRNQIMSNSTFGWWGAALRRDPSGLVVAPRPWLNPLFRGDRGLEVRLPADWVTLAVRGQGNEGHP
jgi:hypothetical protein